MEDNQIQVSPEKVIEQLIIKNSQLSLELATMQAAYQQLIEEYTEDAE